ncbi:hypothetical protein M2263_003209 [Providencia alcalifaciens]|nr:hypothetical protein [Providencia alcalifaciens]
MKNIEKKQIKIGDTRKTSITITDMTLIIKKVREDERKSIFNRISDRWAILAIKTILEEMSAEEITNLINGESEHFSNLAAELNHV